MTDEPLMVHAESLLPGMLIDLEPLWTADYDYGLHAYAESEYGVVELAKVEGERVLIYLTSAPANAVAPVGMTFAVHGNEDGWLDPCGNYWELPEGYRWATEEETEKGSVTGYKGMIGVRLGGTDDDPDVDLAVQA